MSGTHLDPHRRSGSPAAPENADPTKLTCPRCGAAVSHAEPTCPQCGEVFFSAPDREGPSSSTAHPPDPALTAFAQQVDRCLIYAAGGPQFAASLAESERVDREDSWFPRFWS
jgi:ribosomal protein S27AE